MIQDFFDIDETDEQLFTQDAVIKTGSGGNVEQIIKREVTNDPNATRWLFNPYEIIDLRNDGASSGFPYLSNLIFNCVKSIYVNNALVDAYNLPQATHNANNYASAQRTAYSIMRELTDKHGDKGVIDITELTGKTESEVASINTMLFGNAFACIYDVNFPEHPVPVLANMLETLEANIKTNVLTIADQNTRATVIEIAKKVRAAITQAAIYARAAVGDAMRRMLDERNPNRALSEREKRCYLALGEEIPNQMPLLTKSAVTPQQGTSPEVIANVVAEVLDRREAMKVAKESVAPITAPPKKVKIPEAEKVTIGQTVIADGKEGTVLSNRFGQVEVDLGGEVRKFAKTEIATV